MLCIIQARTNSNRFHKKILHKIYGKPIIEWVFKRISNSTKISEIIVATSNLKSDDNLVEFLKKNKINFFRGKLENVASRYIRISEQKNQNYVLRISADSPLIDTLVIDRVIDYFRLYKKKKPDLVTNIFPRSLPSGQSVEIINTKTLKNTIRYFTKIDKEHVTRYFYRKSKKFKILNLKFKNKINYKMSIDTKKDLNLILKKLDKNKFLNFKII